MKLNKSSEEKGKEKSRLNPKRRKKCSRCEVESNIMYRVQYKDQKVWCFICKSCLILVKPDNSHYRYGGTWKK